MHSLHSSRFPAVAGSALSLRLAVCRNISPASTHPFFQRPLQPQQCPSSSGRRPEGAALDHPQRCFGCRRASASQHLHQGLRAEHPLLISGKDQGLLAGQVLRLGADVPFSIKEQNPQQPASGIKELH